MKQATGVLTGDKKLEREGKADRLEQFDAVTKKAAKTMMASGSTL